MHTNIILQVSKIAYHKGMVVSTCKHCKQYHLIADNERKLDMGKDYGLKIEDYLELQGETVQRLSVSLQELDDNYLIDKDGVLSMIPKAAGQVSDELWGFQRKCIFFRLCLFLFVASIMLQFPTFYCAHVYICVALI